MNYFITKESALKWLESPAVYHLGKDELYELDEHSFSFLKQCASSKGCTKLDSAFIDYCVDEGLLTQELIQTKRPPLIKSPIPSLRYLELQITNACNLRCKHCYIEEGLTRELTVEQIRRVLKEFEEMQGLRVMLSGGEPLLHRHFGEINDLLPDFLFRKVLFTNGLLLTDSRLKRLNVHEIQISIDGLEQAHDSLRGRGSYQLAMDTLRRVLAAGLEVAIATMVHPGSTGDLDAMERMFRNMGVKDWTVDIPCTAGRMNNHPEFHLTPQEGGKYLGYGYGAGLHTSDEGHACGLHLMAVMPDGKAAKCTFYGDDAVGTIEEGLRTCWSRIRPIKLERLQCDCEYREACRGGCRYRGELTDGIGGKDLYRCALYGIL